MGNTASTAGASGDMPLPPPPPPPSSSQPEVVAPPVPGPEVNSKFSDCPGSMEQIHNKAHDVFPVPFDGAKLVVNKAVSQHFQVSHTISLSQVEPPGYRFGVTYVGFTKYSESEVFPVCLGELHPNGNLSAQIIHQPRDFWRTKYIGQIQGGSIAGQHFVNELRGTTWQVGATVANPDPLNGRVTCLVDFMKKVSSSLSMGSVFLYQRSPQHMGGQMGLWTVGGKYTAPGDKWEAAFSSNPFQLTAHGSYHLKVNDSLQFAAEIATDHRQQTSTATVGYQYDLAAANLTFKAQMDSNWNIGAVLEKKLVPFPFTFALCAAGNQAKSRYSFGMGLSVG